MDIQQFRARVFAIAGCTSRCRRAALSPNTALSVRLDGVCAQCEAAPVTNGATIWQWATTTCGAAAPSPGTGASTGNALHDATRPYLQKGGTRVGCVYSIRSRRALVLVQESAKTVATLQRYRLRRRPRRR